MRSALPASFSDLYSSQPDFLAALDAESVVSVRLNPYKPFECRWIDAVPWCGSGRYIATRPSFTLDPTFAAGGYYVQEASSMFLEFLFGRLDVASDARILDLCAAPGGKSTHLQALAGPDAVVVANEVIRSRAGVLALNITKWGLGNGVVTSADAATFGVDMASSFDVVVVDAPCSGEGMFRKDDTARTEWSASNVALCAARARRIVSDSWDALKTGGYLIYSTCTFNRFENEDNVEWIATNLGGEVVLFDGADAGIERSDAGYRFLPHRLRGEGFFIAVIRKTAAAPSSKFKFKKRSQTPLLDFVTTPLLSVQHNQTTFGYTPAVALMVEQLRAARIQMLTAGVEIGQIMHGKLKPEHALAIYWAVNRDFFRSVELSEEMALVFLRKNAIAAEILEDGLQLVTFKNLPLGFAKRIGARVNNLYPTSWRIIN